MSELREKMVRYRAKHKLTQEKFAELCGLSTLTIQQIEKGKESVREVTRATIELLIDEDESK